MSTDDADDYKRNVRPAVRASIDASQRHAGAHTDYILLYVRPQASDPAAKAPKKACVARVWGSGGTCGA